MKQSSNLNKCTSKYFLGALLFSFLLNSAIIQAQNTSMPKRTVVEIDVSQLDKKFNTNTINCNLIQFNNPLFPKLAASGQNIGEKKFKIVLNLVQSNVFVLIVDEKYGNDYAIDDLFLEPGDSISIKTGDGINNYTQFSGKGANNNPLRLDEKLTSTFHRILGRIPIFLAK